MKTRTKARIKNKIRKYDMCSSTEKHLENMKFIGTGEIYSIDEVVQTYYSEEEYKRIFNYSPEVIKQKVTDYNNINFFVYK